MTCSTACLTHQTPLPCPLFLHSNVTQPHSSSPPQLLPIRYWAMWASEFAVFFTRWVCGRVGVLVAAGGLLQHSRHACALPGPLSKQHSTPTRMPSRNACCSCLLTRASSPLHPTHLPPFPSAPHSCLLYWSRLNHTRTEGVALAAVPSADESHEPDWQTVAATLAFAAEQNAGADCLPCIRLLAGAV